MVEVNLLGAMTATEVFLDQLRDGGGDLVNISSVAGRTARPGNAAYAATKWGLNGWSEVPAPGAPARRARDRHRARRRGDRADRPHHPRRDQAGTSSSSTTPRRSPPTTSRRSSPSPSPGRAASRSTRSSSDPRPSPDAAAGRAPPTGRRRSRLTDIQRKQKPALGATVDRPAVLRIPLAVLALAGAPLIASCSNEAASNNGGPAQTGQIRADTLAGVAKRIYRQEVRGEVGHAAVKRISHDRALRPRSAQATGPRCAPPRCVSCSIPESTWCD